MCKVYGHRKCKSLVCITDVIYPVGSIYMSINSENPATLFGGTWEQIKDTFLLAAGTTYAAGATGGEARHALTERELPPHTHTYTRASGAGSGQAASGSGNRFVYEVATGSTTTGTTGEGEPFNNMPPYLAVNVWKRTA